ncbi:hypothetical protein F4820DRAFT_450686 [Hypoxylon rubiginosum]|uniref:Uncharacterized protein n=1 Tax=Hypoxylon rubiginosum TaxID=110542 RepID=A0ACB9YUU2_9PEZI|nr:hypothetical protein F4820DRAFT_450686 [Hypoxylon rubiginosum]
MSIADDIAGWAIRRNGSCLLTQEVDCGETITPFRACCPSSTVCPSQYNVACCQSGTNCTTAIVETPRCANSSWAMFDNAGYFCCEDNQVGYNNGGSDGCSRSGVSIPDGASPLAEVDQVTLSSTTSSASSTSTSTTTSSSPPSSPISSSDSDSSSSTPVGAIAGGVVGGVALVAIILAAIFLFRRRRSRAKEATGYRNVATDRDTTTAIPDQIEIDGTPRAELPTKESTRVYELS